MATYSFRPNYQSTNAYLQITLITQINKKNTYFKKYLALILSYLSAHSLHWPLYGALPLGGWSKLYKNTLK